MGVERPQRLVHDGEVRVHQRPHPLRSSQVLEAVSPEVDERRPVGQGVDTNRGRAVRDQDLPAVAGVADAGRADDRRADVVLVAPLDGLAGVDAHPDPDGQPARPWLPLQRELSIERRRHRVRRPAERAHDAVTLALLLRTGARPVLDRRSKDLVVTGDRHRHVLRPLLPRTRRPLDIGQQERHRARRQPRHVSNRLPHRAQPAPHQCTTTSATWPMPVLAMPAGTTDVLVIIRNDGR